MTNFIYIFMIITLICIGAGIKAFNSEDSDTKTTIKNIPNGIKKVLLIGTNVQKTDITILIGTIIYLMFTIGVICIYVFASHETKVELQYKLCVAFLVMLFLETFIVVSVSYREKKTQNKAMYTKPFIYHMQKKRLNVICFRNILFYLTSDGRMRKELYIFFLRRYFMKWMQMEIYLERQKKE